MFGKRLLSLCSAFIVNFEYHSAGHCQTLHVYFDYHVPCINGVKFIPVDNERSFCSNKLSST